MPRQKEKQKKKEKRGRGHQRQETYPGWTKLLDEATGQHYYQNRATGKTLWAKTLALDNGLVNPAPAHTLTAEELGRGSFAHGWAEHVDRTTEIPFYYNIVTGQTSLQRPSSLPAPKR